MPAETTIESLVIVVISVVDAFECSFCIKAEEYIVAAIADP